MKNTAIGELFIKISKGPCCPRCGEDRFDDWHSDRTLRPGDGIVVLMTGALRCHTCSRYFSITVYNDGQCHSMSRKRRRAALTEETGGGE